MARKARRRGSRYSGIGGQAVLEGVMMKNQEKYAVAVRRPDGGVSVEVDNYRGVLPESAVKKMPFVRGVFNFIESIALGMKCLNYSASFYEEDEEIVSGKPRNKAVEKLVSSLVTCFAVAMALGLFVALPYYLASLLKTHLKNQFLMAVVEGGIRIAVFLLYVAGISIMKDIQRLYCYHGAEHMCINCIERGKPLTVGNVMRSSRFHRRCGTSFIFFVLIVSIVLFFFIRVENPVARVGLRILLMPVVAGISYEIIRLAGRTDHILVRILSAPGLAVQQLTTKEPDKSMVEVAMAAVEAVFDWKEYLRDNFGYEMEEDFGEMVSEW